MESIIKAQIRRRLVSTIERSRISSRTSAPTLTRSSARLLPSIPTRTSIRHASSTSSSSSASSSAYKQNNQRKQPPKHTVLPQPDVFRPPSHGSRLKARSRSTTGTYGDYGFSGGYNQRSNEREREEQKTRSYPHMFPNEGTFMHWFLTSKAVHLWISLGTLSLLAIITLTQSFMKSSPFAHLIPPLSSLPFHPIEYVRDSMSAVRLHIDYTTEQTAEKRRQNILDAQKRRLYRRAHGMEDLEKDNEGIDVKGLVEWDDGMGPKEREKLRLKKIKELEERGVSVDELSAGGSMALAVDGNQGEGREVAPKRKAKRWLGIWE